MTDPIYNELSREQKLLGEIIVQLGNISEAISVLATKDVELLEQKVSDLEARLASLNAQFSSAESSFANITPPDTLSDVVSNLGIQLPQ